MPHTQNRQDITELVLVVDRSGSMGGLESDTIGGINATIERNRRVKGACNVSVVLFDDETDVLLDRVDINLVPRLTERDYRVRGCTALLDALGGAIRHTEGVQRLLPPDRRADHVILSVITDGLENASRHYDYSQIKEMIHGAEAMGWEFIFLGANIDAVAEAESLGIRADRASQYVSDSQGSRIAYEAMSKAQVSLRECGHLCADWSDATREDARNRG